MGPSQNLYSCLDLLLLKATSIFQLFKSPYEHLFGKKTSRGDPGQYTPRSAIGGWMVGLLEWRAGRESVSYPPAAGGYTPGSLSGGPARRGQAPVEAGWLDSRSVGSRTVGEVRQLQTGSERRNIYGGGWWIGLLQWRAGWERTDTWQEDVSGPWALAGETPMGCAPCDT